VNGGWLRTATIAAAVGSGVMGGVYFAFSTFVMPALRRLPADRAVAAMQAINRAAPAPFVVVGLLGAGGTCVALAIEPITDLHDGAARWRLAGSGLYLVSLVITFGFHVPRNEALDRVDVADRGAGPAWEEFVGSWTAGNHVRAIVSVAAATMLSYALTVS